VDTSEQQGVLQQEESAMIHGIFDFGDTIVREVMRPRIDVVALDVDTPIVEAASAAVSGGHTRIPVYEGTIDNPIGVLYVKDLLRLLEPGEPARTLRQIMHPPYFVPESQLISQVFHDMRSRHVHLAIVLDEYGGMAGIVTIEDLLEEIVGDIQDEYDIESPEVEKIDENTYLVDGGVTVGTINDLLDTHLSSATYDTVAGLIYSQRGASPKEGDVATADALTFTVVTMEGRRIRRIRIDRHTGDEDAPSEEGHAD
ncbi:MAG: hemolysin family protein, partial [Chloroflexi bacterium]|nr:hemolysin family protein [Chloroflexota bacterium]